MSFSYSLNFQNPVITPINVFNRFKTNPATNMRGAT